MENRLVIKKIHFTKINGKFKQDIKIKLSHNSINLLSDIFWEYNNNELINWKFIFINKLLILGGKYASYNISDDFY